MGNSFPSSMSEVFKKYDETKGIDFYTQDYVKQIKAWLIEYEDCNKNDPEQLFDLADKGVTVLDTVYVLKAVITHLYQDYKDRVNQKRNRIMSEIPGEKMSEAARGRMADIHEEYNMMTSHLIQIESSMLLATDVSWGFSEKLKFVYAKVEWLKFQINKMGGLDFLQKKSQDNKQGINQEKTESIGGMKNFKI